MNKQSDIDKQINEVKKSIDDLKNRWPFHSPKPAMFQKLEELEEELAHLLKKKPPYLILLPVTNLSAYVNFVKTFVTGALTGINTGQLYSG
jgi:hypothetical protein